ncbi:hypothetical protein ScPMuIL_011562 [Solemya velum]
MAASSPDTSMETDEGGTPTSEDRKDAKRKKIGFFGQFKRLVRGSKKVKSPKGDVSTVSHKRTDKTAISEDEDDGGFKTLTASRSNSEGSVFSPKQSEPRESMKSGAASVDNISKNLQSELSNRLRLRRAYSSEDDDLFDSPIEFVSSGRSKQLSDTGANTSEGSLASIDGSDQEGDGKSGRRTPAIMVHSHSSESDEDKKENMSPMNLDVVQVETERPIHHQAAKDKIHVRQPNKRKPSQRHRQKPGSSTPPLARVKEESPTKVLDADRSQSSKPKDEPELRVEHAGEEETILQITKEGSKSTHIALIDVKKDNSHGTGARIPSNPLPVPPKPPTPEPTSWEAGSSPGQLSSSPVSQSMLDGVKLRSRPLSMREDRKEEQEEHQNSELSKAFGKVKRFSLIKDTPTGDSKETSVDVGIRKETPKAEITEKTKPLKTVETRDTTLKNSSMGSDVKFVLRKEPLKSASSATKVENEKRKEVENKPKSPFSSLERPKPSIETSQHKLHYVEGKITSVDTKESPKISSEKLNKKIEILEEKTENRTAENITIKDGRSVKIDTMFGDKMPQRLPVQKEEYKAKREQRSKTLPAQPLSADVLENKPRPDLSKSLKDGRPREGQARPFKEIVPHVEQVKTVTETKTQQNFGRSFKEKLQEDETKGFKDTKTSQNFAKNVKDNKPEEVVSKSSKESKPSELSQSLKESKPGELSNSSKENRAEREVHSPGRNVSTALTKRVEPKRLSWVGASNTSEPAWVARAKQKQAEEEQKESEKDIKNNANNMESKSKDTPVIKDTPKTPPGRMASGRGNVGGSSTETPSIALTKQPLDKTDNKKRIQDTKPKSEVSQTSSAKRNFFEPKNPEKTKEIEKVPAWRAGLSKTKQKDGSSVKIEIIEKTSPDIKIVEKKEEKPTSSVLREKPVEKFPDISSHRSSKVLDLVKNFQTNLQVS